MGQFLLLSRAGPREQPDLQSFIFPPSSHALPLPGAISVLCPRGCPPRHLSLSVHTAWLRWQRPFLAAGPGGRLSRSMRPPKSPPCEVECDRTRVTYGIANGQLTDWTGAARAALAAGDSESSWVR